MPKEFTYDQIAHLNVALEEQHLPYRVHYKDGQQAGIEGYSSCACDGKEDKFSSAVEQYFRDEGMNVAFSSDGYTLNAK
ncbi:hypothetical protein lbkm_3637 [Lachnospiraceae bacterium KM106-2]|nr:hypothetical protein lbkm_3637 [Lachnospiraceae bacterium KM106-2]